ncbi:MAG: AAA family ATPase [Peptococcaceae bacterium]|nr:AAA family ATPase [Peptococcaceae bacterium]
MNWFTCDSNIQATDTIHGLQLHDRKKPILIYGPAGVGKTTLLRRLYFKYKKRNGVVWTTADHFARSFAAAVHKRNLEEFRRTYRTANLLIIDDLQNIGGKRATTEELIHTYEQITQKEGLIVVSIPALPDRKILGQKLSSFVLGGETIPIYAPVRSEMTQFVGYYTARRKLVLDEKIPEELGCLCRNFKEVVQKLERFIQFAEAENEALSYAGFERFCSRETALQFNQPTPENVLRVTGETLGIPVSEILGNKRSRPVVEARRLAVFSIRELCQNSYNEIGKIFHRNHSSMILLCRQAKEMRQKNQWFQENLIKIDQWFRERKQENYS